MAQKKSYSRYFIILQEDEKGYSLSSDKVASGYAKLEMKNDKCKISYYVQNLKKQTSPYYMVLICNKKDIKKIIKIGEMNIDEYGRSDICYEYPVENVSGSGISMDKISGAAIVKFVDSNIVPVMSGFASTDVPDWRNFSLIKESKRSVSSEQKTVKEKSIFDKYEESIEKKIKKPEEKESKVDKVEQIEVKKDQVITEKVIENKTVEDKTIEDKIYIQNPIEEPVENLNEKNCNMANQEIEESYRDEDDMPNVDYPRGSTGDFFRGLVEEYEECSDCYSNIKRCKWYRIPVNCIEDLYDMSDYDKYTVCKYPMIKYHSYIENYGHYMVGYKCDKQGDLKYLVYGIPGSKNSKDQPYGGKTGFVTWVPCRSSEEQGYWLMFYDFRTSTILIPTK